MTTSVVDLGPFSGGLNLASDASAIADNELSEAINVNIDYDGSVVCRVPISQVPLWRNYPNSGPTTVSGRFLVLGTYIIGSTNIPYIMMSSPRGIIAAKITTRGTVDWLDYVVVSTTVLSDCIIQLNNTVYIIATPDSPGDSILWNGDSVFVDAGAPRGSAGVFFKGRVWVVPGAFATAHPAKSQLRFTDPVPLVGTWPSLAWNAANLIPVGFGDGQNLIDLLVVNDNLMLFKNNSTYMYMFDVSPNEGILRKINNNIGVSAQFCALTHENEAYVYHEGSVYQIVNNTFVDTNIKVPFKHPLTDDGRREKVVLSLVKDTIIVRYFNSLYALNLITKTWTEWRSANSTLNSIGRIVKLETNVVCNKLETYFGGSVLTGNSAVMAIKEAHTSQDEERAISTLVAPSSDADPQVFDVTFTQVPIECKLVTKIFDFGTPHLFKRLMWWGVDMIGDGRIIGLAKPARQTLPVTWDALSEFRWDQLFTWDQLLEQTAASTTDFNDPYVIRRKFIKLLKSLRFRRISFTVRFFSDGKTSSEQTLGPSRVFSISAIVGAKQAVVKQVE